MNSAIIAAVLLIAFVIIVSILFLRFIKYLATRETSTEDLISDCFDSYFQLQKRLSENPRYKPGEVVAVAQKYKDAHTLVPDWIESKKAPSGIVHWDEHPGYSNKEFVKAEWMPHQIRITNVRVERLKDISDEDCLREGIIEYAPCSECGSDLYSFNGATDAYYSPREAFAALIKKMAGKKAWDDNPWVFVYEFELVK